MPLRAIVLGTGWAGEGHTLALRHAGVNVVAICDRPSEGAIKAAARLGVACVRFDWQQAIEQLRPDLVSIDTTAPPHLKMAEFVAKQGCHIVCDKPLAMNSADAEAMCVAAERAGIEHAYAASFAASALVSFVKSVVDQGAIGTLRHIELQSYHLPKPERPFCWWHRLADGGGELNTGFTHRLQAVLRITNGIVEAAGGTAIHSLERAPIAGDHHDLRDAFARSIDLAGPGLTWGRVDAEDGYIANLRLLLPDGSSVTASVHQVVGRGLSRFACHGTDGSLTAELGTTSARLHRDDGSSEEMKILRHFFDNDGDAANPVQRAWNQLFVRFIRHVEGGSAVDYPTFRDGLVACRVIEAICSGKPLSASSGSPDRVCV